MVLNLEQALLEKLRTLPPSKRQEVLDFAEFLARDREVTTSGKDFYGLWADLDIDISEEDIAECRREMWGNFPKADF